MKKEEKKVKAKVKKKLLSLAMAFAVTAVTFGVVQAPVYAADQEVTSAQTVTAEVTTASGDADGSDASVFVVAIPQDIQLTRTSYITFRGNYSLGVKAVLVSGKKVKVTPQATFDMSNGVDTYTASVTQDVTAWVDAEATPGAGEIVAGVNDYTTTTGTITVDIEKAGEYSGNLGFTVTLE